MSHAANKVEWCLKKAEKEIKEFEKHRGLIKINPDLKKAREHIDKAEHYLKATDYLKKGNYSDISTSTIFYSVYHCLLGIAAKFGYVSHNQECTFALVYSLIEKEKIDFEKDMLDKISSLDFEKGSGKTALEIREQYQYGTSMSIKDNLYQDLFTLSKEFISKTKLIIEK
jgi:uncharacterized protein (UPF0332 family)